MPDPTTKADLLALIHTEHARLDDLLSQLDDAQMVRPGVDGWSAKDILAHITFWEQDFLRWYRAGQRGEIPDRPDSDNIDPFNQQIYEANRARDLADVRAGYAASYREILAAVEGMSEAELFTPGHYAWTGEYPLAVYLRSNTDEHYAEHVPHIQALMGS